MSLEPEKPIESMLRRYARKRRERIGESWQVPPATRRAWEQELARKFVRNRTTSDSWLRRLILVDWLRPIMAVTSVAVLILGAWLLLGRQGDRATKAEFSSVGSAGSPTSGVVQLAANDKASTPESATTLDNSKQVAVSTTSERLLQDRDDSQALQSPAPTETRLGREKSDIETPAVSLEIAARNRVDKPNTSGGVNVTPAVPAQDALARSSSSAAAAGIAAPLTLTPEKEKVLDESSLGNEPLAIKTASAQTLAASKDTADFGRSATNFVQLGLFAGSQAIDLGTAESRPLARGLSPSITRATAPRKLEAIKRVLTSFSVEQAGRELRVIDSDGSVYAGSILSTNPVSSVTQISSALSNTSQKLKEQSESEVKQEAGGHAMFQLMGTNKSLNRRLVFSGILSTNQDSVRQQLKAPTANGIGGAFGDVQKNGKLEALHLSGTAVIDGEQPIQIEAEPAVR